MCLDILGLNPEKNTRFDDIWLFCQVHGQVSCALFCCHDEVLLEKSLSNLVLAHWQRTRDDGRDLAFSVIRNVIYEMLGCAST